MKIIYFVRYIWELPQNMLGLVFFMIHRKHLKRERLRGRTFLKTSGFGISLGNYIFWTDREENNKTHEYGHAIQSLYFGPLYLVVIGIPSLGRHLFGRLYDRVMRRGWNGYYKGYPEKWADKLGKRLKRSVTT